MPPIWSFGKGKDTVAVAAPVEPIAPESDDDDEDEEAPIDNVIVAHVSDDDDDDEDEETPRKKVVPAANGHVENGHAAPAGNGRVLHKRSTLHRARAREGERRVRNGESAFPRSTFARIVQRALDEGAEACGLSATRPSTLKRVNPDTKEVEERPIKRHVYRFTDNALDELAAAVERDLERRTAEAVALQHVVRQPVRIRFQPRSSNPPRVKPRSSIGVPLSGWAMAEACRMDRAPCFSLAQVDHVKPGSRHHYLRVVVAPDAPGHEMGLAVRYNASQVLFVHDRLTPVLQAHDEKLAKQAGAREQRAAVQ